MTEDPVNALTTINLMDKLFPPPPYECEYRRGNPDLEKLLEPTYREDYEEVKCSKCGKGLAIYQRDIGEYDDHEIETLCKEDWWILRRRPEMQIVMMKAKITRALFEEKAAGIIHYERTYDWLPASLEIPVPELVAREPTHD